MVFRCLDVWHLAVTVSVHSVPLEAPDAIRPASPKAVPHRPRHLHIRARPSIPSFLLKRRRSFLARDLRRLMNRNGCPELIPSLVHTLQDKADPKFLCSN